MEIANVNEVILGKIITALLRINALPDFEAKMEFDGTRGSCGVFKLTVFNLKVSTSATKYIYAHHLQSRDSHKSFHNYYDMLIEDFLTKSDEVSANDDILNVVILGET